MTPQTMDEMATMAVLGVPRFSMVAAMEAKAWPQVADWMPNQPTQAMANRTLMMYLAPCLPRAPSAMTATGRPVSQACMPTKIIYRQMRP